MMKLRRARWFSTSTILSSDGMMAFEPFFPKPKIASNAPSSSSSFTAPISSSHTIGFLHGILGNKKNWRTPAKTFLLKHPHYSAFTVDLRGHGDSNLITEDSPPNTVEACAKDLLRLFTAPTFQSSFPHFKPSSLAEDPVNLSLVNRPNIVLCGHSFGGKVLLELLRLLTTSPSPSSSTATTASPPILFTTFILDSIPDIFDPNFDSSLYRQHSVYSIIRILKSAPKVFSTKQHAYQFLQENELSKSISEWLLMNLYPVTEPGGKITGWEFSFDIDGIEELFDSFQSLSYWDLLERFNLHPSQERDPDLPLGKIVFVRAGKNPFWKHNSVHEQLEEICRRNPHVQYVTMPHVGHWLHSEDLLGLLEVMKPFLPSKIR